MDILDFGTIGVIAFARRCPFSSMPYGKLTVANKRVQILKEYRENMVNAIDNLVDKIS